MYDLGTFLVAGLIIFEVLSSVIFTPAEQCSKVLLLVFAFRMNIKTACDICGLAILEETQSIRGGLYAVDLRSNLHCDVFICRTVIPVDDLIAGRTGLQDICALFSVACVSQLVILSDDYGKLRLSS